MDTFARLDLSVWRNDDTYEFPLRVVGLDLRDTALAMQVRLAPDTPGEPLIDLGKVTGVNDEGLHVASVTMVDGVPSTDLRIRIAKTTRQAMPYAGEIGDAAIFSYALLIAGRTRLIGALMVEAHSYGSDDAPLSRTSGFGVAKQANGARGGASLTIAEDGGITLAIDGAGELGGLIAQATAQAEIAAAERELAQQAAASVTDIAGELNAAATAVSDFHIEPIDFQEGSFSIVDGSALPSGSNFRRALLPAKPGEQFKYTGSITGGNAAVAVFYDSSGVFLAGTAQYPGSDGVTSDYSNTLIVAPAGTGFVGFTGFAFDAAGFASPTMVKRRNVAGNVAQVASATEQSLSTYQEELFAAQSGSFFWPDGSIVADSNFRRVLLPTKPGERLLYTGVVGSGVQAAAIFFDADGVHIPHAERFVGANGQFIELTDQKIESPAGAFYVGFTTFNFTEAGFAAPFKIKRPKVLPNVAERILQGVPQASYWRGKNIVWFGTSIPETGYPLMVGEALDANVVNEAVGSSSARFGVATQRNVVPGDIYGLNGLSWFLAVRSLSKTAAEAEDLIANWSFYRTLFDPASGPPATLSIGEADYIRETSWEVKLNRNLDADLFVFDHGYNDWFANRFGTSAGATSGGNGDMLYLPGNTRDRGTYLGAMNFLIDKILQHNPRARIAFVSHFENDRDVNVALGQAALAETWSYPFIKMYEKTGWGNQTVATTGSWSDRFTWNPSGGPLQNLLIVSVWMQDGLHPYSTPAQEFLAEILATEIDRVR